MAQRRRAAKEGQTKLERITLMIPSELKAELDTEVEAGVRTFSDAVRQRLTAGVQPSAWADVEQQLTGDAKAFGRLAALLANEVGRYSEPGDQAQELKAMAGYLVDRVFGTAEPKIPNGQAGMVVGYWELRLQNAHERSYKDGTPIPMTSEQRALAEIRSDLGIGQAAATAQSRKKRERE